jgi:hypothetical protein
MVRQLTLDAKMMVNICYVVSKNVVRGRYHCSNYWEVVTLPVESVTLVKMLQQNIIATDYLGKYKLK